METLVNGQLYRLMLELNELRKQKTELETRESELKDDIQIEVDGLPEDWELPCAVQSGEENSESYKLDLRMGTRKNISADMLKALGVSQEIIEKATKTSRFPVIGPIQKL